MNNPTWYKEIEILKLILAKTELKMEIKWGAEIYCLNGKMVVGIGSFTKHFAIWFYNGVFLKDESNVLVKADENTKAMRQWRFAKNDIIDENLILSYIFEAIENEKNGLVWKNQKKDKQIIIPDIFIDAFLNDFELKDAFINLSFSKQKEYIDYVLQAKKIETQTNRLAKISFMIKMGKMGKSHLF